MCEWLSSMIERTNGWDWGDVPTWVASFAGLAALIVASYAAAKTRAMLKIESDRDKAARDRDERAQADLVAAWLEQKRVRGSLPLTNWQVTITNASPVPVYEFQVLVTEAASSPNDSKSARRSVPVIGPGERQFDFPEVRHVINSEAQGMPSLGLWITFRDASGVHWTRSNEGILSRGITGPFVGDHPARDANTPTP